MTKPLLIAHRGDATNYKENTITAFASAFDNGADGVELDVQFYKNKLIVVHNYLFEKDRTYPELAEVLKRFAGKGRLEIEIKSLNFDFLPQFKDLLARYKNADIEITTSVWPIVSHLRQELSDYSLGIIFPAKEFEDWMSEDFIYTKVIKFMQIFGGNVAHLPWPAINDNQRLVEACHDIGIKVHSHIFRQSPAEELAIYKRMSAFSIDQCTFDSISLIAATKE